MNMWFTIDDAKVRHVWRCPECEDEVNVSPCWYENTGTPVCADCDEDMKYISTEIAND